MNLRLVLHKGNSRTKISSVHAGALSWLISSKQSVGVGTYLKKIDDLGF